MARSKFAVIGLGQFGSAIARKLAQKNVDVLAIDISDEKVEAIKDQVPYAVTLDSTDSKALMSQNISEMDAVVVAIGANFQDLLLTTFVLQELKVKRIIARAQGPTQKRILEKMGIEEILSPEDEVGNSIAETLVNPNVLVCMQLPDDFEIVEIKAPRAIVNRTLDSIGLREKYKINLVTLLHQSDDNTYHVRGVPNPDNRVEEDDIIVVFGKTSNINRFIEINK